MMDSVSVVTSCSPRRAMSRTFEPDKQWAAVTWDKTGYAVNLCTVTVTSHREFSSAAPQLGVLEPFSLRPTIQGYSLTSTLWPPTTLCLMFCLPQTENNESKIDDCLRKKLTAINIIVDVCCSWWIRIGSCCCDCKFKCSCSACQKCCFCCRF